MWVLQQITLGLCSAPSHCRVEKAGLRVPMHPCQSSMPSPCSPTGLPGLCWQCPAMSLSPPDTLLGAQTQAWLLVL